MSLYKQGGSDVWWASVTVNGERLRFSTGEYDRAAAQKVHDLRKAEQHSQPRLKGKTWGTAVLAWAEAEVRSESDLQSLAKFGGFYKDRSLTTVTAESLDEALRKFVKTDGTYNRYVARINAILKLAGRQVRLTKKRNKSAKPRGWITHEQWDKLYAQLPLHLKASALFAVSTGLRQANVLGLQWSRVDLERRTAWIDSPDTKSGKPIGIPLNSDALAALKAVAGQHDVWVFTYRGKPYSEIKTAFQRACIRSGVGTIGSSGRYEGFTWHGLRHTWATWHAQNGTPLEVLQELGGWTDMRMLTENYAHHVAGLKAKYAENVRKK